LDVGYQAARLLHLIFQNKKVPHLTLLPPLEVVGRASTDVLAVPDEHLAKALRYIREHAFEPLSVTNLAAISGLARRSLEERFTRYLDRSPLEEITRLRIEKAIHLLRNSRLDMDTIAEQCGLTTANYMSETFRKKTGLTPRAYRNQFNPPA
jgi:LacI family transcriptional regulator